MNAHERFMRRALALARKAKGKTSPNPMVGAVVVKNGVIVAEGYHKKAGDSHAEVMALDAAKEKARGASLYVTLEPCAHFGRTPPCVNRIIKSGIKHVYVGMVDPNPQTNGKGIKTLVDHGISVHVGFCEAELQKLNEIFITYITKRRPFITVKIAQSLDGKIATESGDSKWITSDSARAFAHRIRSQYDAIMVGINTVLRDNPRLDAWFSKKHPVKVVVDSQLSTPQNAALLEHDRQCIVVTVPTRPGQETENRAILSEKARILDVKEKAGQVNLKDMMRKLAGLEISSVLVEGGGTLIGALFDEGLVDRVMFFVSPKIIGGKNAISSVMGAGASRVEKAVKLRDLTVKRIGTDFLFEGYV